MVEIILWLTVAALACVGFVQVCTWISIRMGSRRSRVYRVFTNGGEGRTEEQLAQVYSCLQWEANPSQQVYVLYDVGLDEGGVRECRVLTSGTGIRFVQSAQELDALLTGR